MTSPHRRGETPFGADADADVLRLRRLLLLDELRELDALRLEVSKLDGRVGSDDRFRRAVADSLVDALKAVEVESHRDLADVMAPLVVSGIRREIVESRDLMVEALYPITGRLVKAAVAASIRELMENINRSLEARLSHRQLRLRAKAMITRRPLSEIILADSANGRFDRMILIDRSVGAVLATTGPDGVPEADAGDALNLLGGLVAAVVEFANHALHDIQGDLRSIDVGGRSVLVRASPLYIVAAMTSAPSIGSKVQASIDAEFLNLLERMVDRGGEAAPGILSTLHTELHARHEPARKTKSRVSPVSVLGALIVLGAGIWIAHDWIASRQRASEASLLAAIERSPDLANDPLSLAFDRDAGVIRATGVLPSAEAAAALKARLAAAFPAWPLAARLAVVSQMPYAKATEASLRDANARIEALDAAAARISDWARGVDSALDDRTTREDVAARIEALEKRVLTPDRQLDAAIAGTAVFFDKAADYHDPERARRALAAMAAAMAADEGARLRIVGYADGSGTPQSNAEAAQARVQRVAKDLEGLGVDGRRLILVTTRLPLPIADEPNPNRRVVFERAYPAE